MSAQKVPVVKLVGTIEHETDKAILLNIDGAGHWFPFSVVNNIIRAQYIGEDTIEVEQWIAKKKGLI
jgi:hypothetical protein